MNSKYNEKEWAKDFKDFVENEAPIPESVSRNILNKINKAVNPSPWAVFAKLLGIHSIIGTLSLSICSQFGMSLFNSDISLSDYFMKVGHSTCMVLCGFLFISLSVLAAWTLLSREEFLVIRKNAFIQIFSLSLLSLIAFIGFGAEIFFGIGALWTIGAMIGGLGPILILPGRWSHFSRS